MDDPAAHPPPVDFNIKTKCLLLDVSIKDTLGAVKPLLLSTMNNLNTFASRMRLRFYGIMRVYIKKCLIERRKDIQNLDLIWGSPAYRFGGAVNQRLIAFNSGKLLDRVNIFPILNRICNPFHQITDGVCKFPLLEEAMSEVCLNDPDFLKMAQETEKLAPICGRAGLIEHIGAQYLVSSEYMMYGNVKRFQSKLLGCIFFPRVYHNFIAY